MGEGGYLGDHLGPKIAGGGKDPSKEHKRGSSRKTGGGVIPRFAPGRRKKNGA